MVTTKEHWPMGNARGLLEVGALALKLGEVDRVTLHPDGRPETDTTHTVMLALLASSMAPQYGLDPGLASMFAVVHDLVEAYAGDTNTAGGLTPAQSAAKRRAETEARARIGEELDGYQNILGLLDRYERQQAPEARFVRLLDKIMPKVTHLLNGGEALRRLGMSAEDTRIAHRNQAAELEDQYPEFPAIHELFAIVSDAATDMMVRHEKRDT